jgi:hypothetical protein
MRTPYILAFAIFPLGAVATLSGPAPESSRSKVADAPSGTLSSAVSAVRKITFRPSASGTQAQSDSSPTDQDSLRLEVGEVLPEGTVLRSVPRHASYRYAIVQGQRAIVDAASRRIVYIIR